MARSRRRSGTRTRRSRPEPRDPRNPVVRWMERVHAGEVWGGPALTVFVGWVWSHLVPGRKGAPA